MKTDCTLQNINVVDTAIVELLCNINISRTIATRIYNKKYVYLNNTQTCSMAQIEKQFYMNLYK